MWCITPKEDAAFVCQMEQVLEVYKKTYDSRFSVVCLDEQPKQLISEKRTTRPPKPGHPRQVDYEYIRAGMCVAWMIVEPLGGWRHVPVTARKTRVDWAHQIQQLVDAPRYANAERITIVCDNLNTHQLTSLYAAIPPEEALRLARKIELVHTPKHGSWLNMTECELSVLSRQALQRCIPTLEEVRQEAAAWETERNQRQTGVHWQFTTADARIKLQSLYPKILL